MYLFFSRRLDIIGLMVYHPRKKLFLFLIQTWHDCFLYKDCGTFFRVLFAFLFLKGLCFRSLLYNGLFYLFSPLPCSTEDIYSARTFLSLGLSSSQKHIGVNTMNKQPFIPVLTALLLIFSILPVYALNDPTIGAYPEDKTTDVAYSPETSVSFAPTEPFDGTPETFWLTKGQTQSFEQGVSLTYLGSSANQKIGADTPKGIPSGGFCEQFQITYYTHQEVSGKDVSGKEVMPDVYPEQGRIVPTSVSFAPAPVLTTPQQVEHYIKPTSLTKKTLGQDAYDAAVVDKSTLVALPAPLDAAASEVLMKRIIDLALLVGGEVNTAFTFNDEDVAQALANILHSKGVQMSQNSEGWKSENIQEFIKYNSIDVNQFFLNVREAQKELSLAQIQTYNAVLYMSAYDLSHAEIALSDAQAHYTLYRPLMDKVMAEINRWQPLPVRALPQEGKTPAIPTGKSGNSKVFCLVPGEVGFPIILYEKKDDAVLVGSTSLKMKIETLPAKDMQKTPTKKPADIVRKDAEASCAVDGKTVPVGTRLNVDGVSQYCDPLTHKLFDQKQDAEQAENNYECLSNESRNGQCVNSLGFLERIWKTITGIFGF